MWCRIPGVGECFSRGLNQKVQGTNNYLSLEIPFYLKKGQTAWKEKHPSMVPAS